jgi:threonine aldolase
MPLAVDVRSDTVTRPTQPMLAAMMAADVGDDVFGEDETVNELQRRAASLFGKEAALFCPTGTMTNQIGIRVHTRPGDEVICDELAHIYLFEGGGIAANCGCSVRLLKGDRGRFTAEQVREIVNRRDDGSAATMTSRCTSTVRDCSMPWLRAMSPRKSTGACSTQSPSACRRDSERRRALCCSALTS